LIYGQEPLEYRIIFVMALDFKNYDQRRYQTVGIVEGYSSWSKSYEIGFDEALDMILLNRLRSISWEEVRDVADLACGTGRTGQWLISKGVQFLDGVDLTEAMLAQAKNRGIYRQLKNEDFRKTSLQANSYSLVTNSLAVEHIPELMPLFWEASRILKPGGYFILLGYHPHFQLRGIPTHFEDNTGESLAITNYIHLISDFVKAGFESKLNLMELDEYVVDANWVERSPGMKKHLGHPISFVGVWRKPLC